MPHSPQRKEEFDDMVHAPGWSQHELGAELGMQWWPKGRRSKMHPIWHPGQGESSKPAWLKKTFEKRWKCVLT